MSEICGYIFYGIFGGSIIILPYKNPGNGAYLWIDVTNAHGEFYKVGLNDHQIDAVIDALARNVTTSFKDHSDAWLKIDQFENHTRFSVITNRGSAECFVSKTHMDEIIHAIYKARQQ
ncbi:MAG: hypothetical protein UV74_C0013G0043 [Candidatus Woesebacteria bacterium GW2011_GWB1_43_14]|uniref:Uncharacterized protein n=1 Tax=Candidatus Woesebacteria bacterium GW2011_GWB1_43_14 TaxID=1618578 RepID=A0A0G1FPG2_9BACT|nr:MAG: hypothetical protein UV51_C0009G0046 [Candidatus Woesebacteria bacterium GW2011_GWC1_42_9]KKS96921.1 MAG: hypothetical protein UV74_C0013G0043 [Candidatus Woesebacteria bacterium GW2011_GWB1_43_14]